MMLNSLLDKFKGLTLFTLMILVTWTAFMFTFDLWSLFRDYSFMSLTMAFGSFIAGATSEGGGAVAFPVMTLIFKIKPHIARDFSLMIQSFGMTAAAWTIYKKEIPVINKAIILSGSSALIGNIIAFNYIVGSLSPALTKIFFCSFWLSFVFVLVLVNKNGNKLRKTNLELNLNNSLLLIGTGIMGGMISAMTGSGLDILTFALLTLYFNICEKIATPTSAILMAINSICSFYLKQFYFGGTSLVAFQYLLVCLPIVVIGAPLGAIYIKDKGRKFITNFLVISICLQYVFALIIIKSNENIYAFSGLVLVAGLIFFGGIFYLGNRDKKSGSMVQSLTELFSFKSTSL